VENAKSELMKLKNKQKLEEREREMKKKAEAAGPVKTIGDGEDDGSGWQRGVAKPDARPERPAR